MKGEGGKEPVFEPYQLLGSPPHSIPEAWRGGGKVSSESPEKKWALNREEGSLGEHHFLFKTRRNAAEIESGSVNKKLKHISEKEENGKLVIGKRDQRKCDNRPDALKRGGEERTTKGRDLGKKQERI